MPDTVHFKTTDDLYGPVDDWTVRDWYGAMRFLTHAFGNAARSEPYARELGRLDFTRMPPEVLALAHCALRDCGTGSEFLQPESREAIENAKPLEKPIRLNDDATPKRTPEAYRSMGVYF